MFDFDDLGEPTPDESKCDTLLPADDVVRKEELVAPRGKFVIIARHAFTNDKIKVIIPQQAKFRHLKRALARRLDRPDIEENAQIVSKKFGRLCPSFDDDEPVAGAKNEQRTQEVLLSGVDLSLPEARETEATLSDNDLSGDGGEEAQAPPVSKLPARGDEDSGIERVSSDAGVTWKKRAMEDFSQKAGAMLDRMVDTQFSAGTRSVASLAGLSEPASSSGRRRPLTKDEAISLQMSLYSGFKENGFQRELALLQEQASNGVFDQAHHAQLRQELLLTVQRRVLPKYGFEGNLNGVYCMVAAMRPFISDPDFVSVARKVNQAIGVDRPPERWSGISDACKRADHG